MSDPTGADQTWGEFARHLFDQLRRGSVDGDGVTRGSYSAAEDVAHSLFANTAKGEGLRVWTDQACNTWLELPGSEPDLPAVVIGSHLDSVRQGGNYDGSAGVFAGLICLLQLAKEPQRKRSVRVVAFRGEESAWFGTCYIGSRSLVGSLDSDLLDIVSPETRTTLREAMIETGADLEPILASEPLVDLDSIHQYLELHIEQGPVLVDADCPVAAVAGIRGNRRYANIVWSGVAGHSGAVPRSLRRDSVLGAAEWIISMERLWVEAEATGDDLVVTTGIVSTDPMSHSITRIPDRVRVSLDLRSVSPKTLDRVAADAESLAASIAERRGLSVSMGQMVATPPGEIRPAVAETIVAAAARSGHEALLMPSGAGHDAAALAAAGIDIGMIFVRNRNGSHNPLEDMAMEDFCVGVDVLVEAVREVANA